MADEELRQIGPYQIIEELGRGGMAVVYRANQSSLNRTVAVKVLPENLNDPSWVERFHREAQAVALLNHPNIVQIIDKGEEDGRLYFAMEYVPGVSLDQILKQRRLSLAEVLKVFKEVCKGLEYAHQHQVIHRDLNPRNILVNDSFSTVKIADFGICRVQSISDAQGTLSTKEVSFGTLHYLAPEQAANMAKSDHRSDIFSLGVLLYEMLTGKVPVGRFNLPSRLNGEVPPEIDPIVLKCLATDPAERYLSVTKILEQVRKLEENLRLRLVDELKGFSRSTGKIFKRSTQTLSNKRSTGLLVGGGVLAVLAVVLAAFLLWPETEPVQVADSEPVAATEATETNEEPAAAADSSPRQPDPVPAAGQEAPPATSSSASTDAGAGARPASEDPPPSSTRTRPTPRVNPALAEARQQFESGLYEPALASVNGLLEQAATGPSAIEGLLLKAAILRQLERPEDEPAIYRRVIADFPDHARAAEARYWLGESLRSGREEGWEQAALDLFKQVGSSSSEFTAPALLRQGELEGALRQRVQDPVLGKDVPRALVTYRRLVEEYPENESSEYAYWSLSNMYQDVDEFEKAAAMLTQLGSLFPQTNWDAWWFAGELFEEKLNDNQRALDAYSKVPESSRNFQRAQRKVRRLGQ